MISPCQSAIAAASTRRGSSASLTTMARARLSARVWAKSAASPGVRIAAGRFYGGRTRLFLAQAPRQFGECRGRALQGRALVVEPEALQPAQFGAVAGASRPAMQQRRQHDAMARLAVGDG